MAGGRTDLFAKICIVELVPYVFLLLALTYNFGPIGAAAAWSARMIGDSLLLFVFARRALGVSLSHTNLNGFMLGTAVLLVPLAANFYLSDLLPVTLVILAAALIIYSLILWKLVLHSEEISWLSGRISRYFA